MDYDKLSSKTLLEMEFVDTPFGAVCKKTNMICLRCHKEFEITVPDDVIKKVDSEEQVGTSIVEYIMETTGWAQSKVQRKGNTLALYTICPDCVEKDFEALGE